MANRLLTGPRRYAELSSATNSAADNTAPNQPVAANPYANNTHGSHYNAPEQPAANPYSNYPNQPVDNYPASNSYQDPNVASNDINASSGYKAQTSTSRATPAATSDQRPRRKSSKSKQIDTDKIPRPDVQPDTSYAPKDYVTSTCANPISSFSSYITVDDGNAGPRYVRSTFYKVPTEESLINNTQVPLGLVIQPLADPSPDEEGVSIMDYGEAGPLRCNRCRGYVNPNWIFTQNGSVGVCNLCRMNNEIPKEYYSPLDAHGSRTDRLEKPELCKGVYEFLAPPTYHTRSLVTPNIVFLVEASSASYLSGVFHQFFSSLQSLLDFIPSPELTKICIVTYDTGVNFFKAPDDLNKEMTIINVPDVNASCLPFPKNYLFLSLQDERDKINYLVERIVKHYETSEKIQKGLYGTCFGAALVDACELLIKDGGRVLAFTTQAPVDGIGKIKKRDDYKLYGTDKEKTLFVSQSDEYLNWAKKWVEKRVSVDLFCFAPEYFDITTIGQVSAMTGGNLYYYPTYKPSYDGEKLHYDLARNLTRYVGYDVALTIRTCQGISFLDYVTPLGRRPIPELEYATIDADTTLNVYLKHDDKLTGEDVTFQVAALYTNPYGQRVIRVINFKLTTSNDIVTIFRSCDVEAAAQLIIKRNILTIATTQISQIRKAMIDQLVTILYNYRYHCASTSSPSQLILPESLKVLPVYFLAVFKAHMLRVGGDVRPDDRSYDLFRFIKTPLNVLSNIFYVKMYSLHDIWTEDSYAPGNMVDDRVVLGKNLAATDEKIDDNGIYLLDNGEFLFIYVKRGVDPIFLQHLFGVETFQDVINLPSFPEYVESEYFTKVMNIIEQLRKNKNSAYQPVRIVTEKDPSEPYLLNLLVEDERLGDSYSTFLCNAHKLIQDKLS